MDSRLQEKLRSLSPLGAGRPETRTCKVCGTRASLFDVVDFHKFCSATPYAYGTADIIVKYYRCASCDFLFADLIDDWTPDEISRYIYNDDYINVDPDYADRRPLSQAHEIGAFCDGRMDLRILDYGSGSGRFARHMVDLGFTSVASYDPFSSPVRPTGTFDLVTAFEVVEHSPDPLETFRELRDLKTGDGAILVGQTLQPEDIDAIKGGWWYLAPRNGHVSTFSDVTFARLARKLGLRYRRPYGPGFTFAFVGESLNRNLERALTRFGLNVTVSVLGAPGAAASAEWHGLERMDDNATFRWSAGDRLTWEACDLEAGVNRIQVPFLMEIEERFAQRCRLAVAGVELVTSQVNRRLVADVEIGSRGVYRVELRTPTPGSPRQLGRSADDRWLGLAIPVQDGDAGGA